MLISSDCSKHGKTVPLPELRADDYLILTAEQIVALKIANDRIANRDVCERRQRARLAGQ